MPQPPFRATASPSIWPSLSHASLLIVTVKHCNVTPATYICINGLYEIRCPFPLLPTPGGGHSAGEVSMRASLATKRDSRCRKVRHFRARRGRRRRHSSAAAASADSRGFVAPGPHRYGGATCTYRVAERIRTRVPYTRTVWQ